MRNIAKAGLAALAAVSFSADAQAQANDKVYANFPVTLQGYKGDAKDSVAYRGQIARQLLHDSLKLLAAQGNGSPNPELKAKMLAYFSGGDAGREILVPKTREQFVILQTGIDELSKGAKLSDKAYPGAVAAWPNNQTGAEVIAFWIDKASSANKGLDLANGYNYVQLISKYLMGAVFLNQSVDVYLDRNLKPDVKPNDKPYGEGAHYTGAEHVWDEAFGYFGMPAHGLTMTAADIYYTQRLGNGAKDPAQVFAAADYNKDGKIDLYNEMAYQPAYYAASIDVDGKTNYVHTIGQAFLDGRKLIASAKGAKLTGDQQKQLQDHATTIETAWEQVYAETTFKYAGETYKDLEKFKALIESKGDTAALMPAYAGHWGELKGFSMALQSGRKNHGDVAVRLNRLIGFSPLMPNGSQVIDIDRAGNYVKSEGVPLDEYMLHMLKVQQLMVDTFKIKARQHDMLAGMKTLTDKIGTGASAEND